MSIYTILSSKPHNSHYLRRYFRFISTRKNQPGATEKHHICPKAADLFPEYAKFKDHKWNMIHLTYREHFIAHWILWKAYGGSQTHAFFISFTGTNRLPSKTYALLREQTIEKLKRPRITKGRQLTEEWKSKIAKSRQSRVMIDGVTYESQQEAATRLGVSGFTISTKIKSDRFPTWLKIT